MKLSLETDMDIDMDLVDELPTMLTGVPVPTSTHTSTSKTREPLSQEAHGNIATRTSDDEGTLLEVDHMIFDYLMHHAITVCVENAHQPKSALVDRVLLQVDEFRALFTARHAKYTFDAELRFRQLLLQLIALTTQRLVLNNATPPPSSLVALRERNLARAMGWIGTASSLPTYAYDVTALGTALPVRHSYLYSNRANFLRSLEIPSSTTEFYGLPESVSLLDLLPLFMRVSAFSCDTLCASEINAQWMRLATEWMLHACLEQYLVYGASGSDAVDEAFAWGYKRGKDEDADADERDSSVNSMFEDSEYAREVAGWDELKKKTLDQLLLHGDLDVRSHLARLAEANPMNKFAEKTIGFLGALSRSIPEPVLVQLEKGKLQGMSKEATQAFLRECGVGDGGLSASL